ncbi:MULTISPECIES: thioredoxin family protein [Dehalococcoides]|jgi:small redox-active disulfide protein 2|uniref:Redox-active disulfide protein 2 n=1 Tax=Dehalococcoides mccartyi TaxID=61435 RepID=A0A1S6SHE1_9CHLR|nr:MULTISPECIES: thioredoxin family protein [Dehalococcoides]AGG06547.1 thioredoxin 3 (CXXC thioredoxin), redox-active disulfide protein 2 [Dehalococcoides mccartyi DCMB5]AGG08037.1 thioredoxin 3 (CXXC thioredoxin), redox-active disulfide protein 2 [Dehalococcoides mccartyi BTF08]AQU06019.1 thioredoxin family protein [Dehalococcoides mccartyi]AQU07464.1 thioredoxin family protein [Dehalococcoides mccartyi]AQW62565.1 thioredoxin family protein [Dehalococcoides mccartyi]
MIIKVLGTGCAKCNKLEEMTKEAVIELGLAAQIVKIKEIDKISAYPILMTPALVIDEEVVISGKIPTKDEMLKLILSKSK